jgi:DnaD/phage-associated family protein
MSVAIMTLVFKHDMPDLKTDEGKVVPDSTAKFVLLCLADAANEEGEGAYIGVRKICKMTSMSTQTVCNALNALRHNKYTTLEDEKSKYKTNNYTINIKKIGFQPLESSDSSHQNEPSSSSGLFSVYENNIGPITTLIADSLKDAEKTYPLEWITDAIRLSVENNKRSWRYCETILKRWQANGKDDGKGKPAPVETVSPAYQPIPEDPNRGKYVPRPSHIRPHIKQAAQTGD